MARPIASIKQNIVQIKLKIPMDEIADQKPPVANFTRNGAIADIVNKKIINFRNPSQNRPNKNISIPRNPKMVATAHEPKSVIWD
jgi:hypothetical protein